MQLEQQQQYETFKRIQGVKSVYGRLVQQIKEDDALRREFLTVVKEDLYAFSPHFYVSARICYSNKSYLDILNEIKSADAYKNRVAKFVLNLLEKGHMSIFGTQYRVVSLYIYPNYYKLLRDYIASELSKIVVLEPYGGNLLVNTRFNMELLRYYLQSVDAKEKEDLLSELAEVIGQRKETLYVYRDKPIFYDDLYLMLEGKTSKDLSANEKKYFNFLKELEKLHEVPVAKFGQVTLLIIKLPEELITVSASGRNPLLRTIGPDYYNFWFVIETTRNSATQILRHIMLNFTQRSNRYTKVSLADYRLSYRTIAKGLDIWKAASAKDRKAKTLEWLELFVNRAKEDINFYNWLLNNGFKKEDARDEIFQRQATTLNAAGLGMFWREFLNLRLAKEAQWYTRAVANAIFELLEDAVSAKGGDNND